MSAASTPISGPTIMSAERPAESATMSDRLNWLRASVLGANDGIVSVAATVVGVAAATSQLTPILLAGVAALIGGAISMALGEYISVSSAADAQRSTIAQLTRELAADREGVSASLMQAYQAQGITKATSEQIARELRDDELIRANLTQRFHLAEDEVLNPWHAAIASAASFLAGALLPFVTILAAPQDFRIPVTAFAVLVALALTGGLGARLGGAPARPAVLRVVAGGILALSVTFAIGALLGVAVG